MYGTAKERTFGAGPGEFQYALASVLTFQSLDEFFRNAGTLSVVAFGLNRA
jgi:hypothetical protein